MIKHIDNNIIREMRKPSQQPAAKAGFASALSNAMRQNNPDGMDAIFERAARTYNVPVELLKAVGKVESNFNPNAVSSAGAQGVMQLMPRTAEFLGVTDPFDPEQNIMGGAKYLSRKIEQYNGDVKLALASYNAGSGNVAKYGGIPPFKETQNFVVKVLNYAQEELRVPDSAITKKGPAGPAQFSAAANPDTLFPYVLYIEFLRLRKMSINFDDDF